MRHLCLHSVTQPFLAQVARAGRGVVFPPLGIYSFAYRNCNRFLLLSFSVTKLRGDVHSLQEIAEEEKEEEDVTMVEEERVEVTHSKKKNKKRKLDTSEELPGKAMHSLYFIGA